MIRAWTLLKACSLCLLQRSCPCLKVADHKWKWLISQLIKKDLITQLNLGSWYEPVVTGTWCVCKIKPSDLTYILMEMIGSKGERKDWNVFNFLEEFSFDVFMHVLSLSVSLFRLVYKYLIVIAVWITPANSVITLNYREKSKGFNHGMYKYLNFILKAFSRM